MATASINLSRAIWGSCKASAVAPGGYTSHRNCSDGWTVTPFVTTARFLDRHRWRTRKLVRELLVSIRVHFSPTSPFPLSSLAANLSLLASFTSGILSSRVGKKFYAQLSMPDSLFRLELIKAFPMMDGCHKRGWNCEMPADIDK